MILALNTSQPMCCMILASEGKIITQKDWLAERRLSKELLGQLEALLSKNDSSFERLSGLVVFRGPGSYTGLRIGVSVMNTLAYGLTIPIAGEVGEEWLTVGQKRLEKGNNDNIVIPEYGGLPHTTSAKK